MTVNADALHSGGKVLVLIQHLLQALTCLQASKRSEAQTNSRGETTIGQAVQRLEYALQAERNCLLLSNYSDHPVFLD